MSSGGLPMSSNKRAKREQKDHETALQAMGGNGEGAKRKAVMDVVQVWLDRLQLVSVITTFFASIDSTLLSYTTNLAHIGNLDPHQWTNSIQTMNAALAGALIFHVCSAITAFVGSFVLIRYKLIDVSDHIPPTREPSTPTKSDFTRPDLAYVQSEPTLPQAAHGAASDPAHALNLFSVWKVWSDSLTDVQGRVSIHRVRLFGCMPPSNPTHVDPPVRLLSNCHTLSVTMAVIGFILALLGILTFAWTSLPTGVASFASICLGACGLGIFFTLSFS